MKRRGPYGTLLAVVVLGAILLGINFSSRPADNTPPRAAVPAPSAPAAAPSPAPAALPPSPAAVPAASSEPFPVEAKYTGHTEGDQLSIAVAVHAGKVSAYLCDGKVIEGWYQGSAASGVIDAKGKGTNALTGSLAGSTLSGTVSAGGRSFNYSATPAAAPAGLYRAKRGNRTTGWIKDSNGRVTGLAHSGSTIEPAEPLDPATAQFVQGGDPVVG